MPVSFASSPNALFDTCVRNVDRLSPGFLRVTLGGPDLARFAAYGLDQRIKILLPVRGGYPEALEAGMGEAQWRRTWRGLPVDKRPPMRSYTVLAVRPDSAEIDLDFYVHEPPGPASEWALAAAPGDRLLVSGPKLNLGYPGRGIQWSPGRATSVLVAGDETAFPAIRGILLGLRQGVRAHVILEVGQPEDAAVLDALLPGHTRHLQLRRSAPGGDALVAAVAGWAAESGSRAAKQGAGFYSWMATESTRIAQLRALLANAGIAAGRVHGQGYWNGTPEHRGGVTRDPVA